MENQVSVSVLTPTVRPEMVEIIAKCLSRQDFELKFEWLITTRSDLKQKIIDSIKTNIKYQIFEDPPMRKDDIWKLCAGWNNLYARSKGELIVNIQDGIYFEHDLLSRMWFHYQQNHRILVGAIGHQYSGLDENGKPINEVWHDPRARTDISFQEVPPSEIEMTINSIPKQAIIECGGIDEIYDTANGAQEKEMCWRLNKMNWDFFLDHSIEYRAIHHPRLFENWDKVYKEVTTPLFVKHMAELDKGIRTLNVNNINKYI
jgi:hypothetical protein